MRSPGQLQAVFNLFFYALAINFNMREFSLVKFIQKLAKIGHLIVGIIHKLSLQSNGITGVIEADLK